MTLHAARYRDRIQVLERTRMRNAVGHEDTWVIVGKRWCELTPLTTSQKIRYMQQDIEATHRLRFRFPVEVSFATTRFQLGDDVFEPTTPDMDKQNRHKVMEMFVRTASPEVTTTPPTS